MVNVVVNGGSGASIDVTLPRNQGPPGPVSPLAIGTVTTGEPGSEASATVSGDPPDQELNLAIPRGDVGPANELSIGTVTTGAPGSEASATISGTPPSQTLDLTIPEGAKGDPGEKGDKGDQGGQETVATKSADYTLAAGDHGATIALSGSHTLTAAAAAALGNGWFVDVVNTGSGSWLLSTNGSDTIRGFGTATWTAVLVYPGEAFRLTSDGVSQFLPKGRARRVLAAVTAASGGANVDIESPYADSEAVAIEHEFEGLAATSTGGTNNGHLAVRYKSGGSYVTSSNYSYAYDEVSSDGGWWTGSTGTYITLAGALTSGRNWSGSVRVSNPRGTGNGDTQLQARVAPKAVNIAAGVYFGALGNQAAAVTGLRFYVADSVTINITGGAIRSYVVRE